MAKRRVASPRQRQRGASRYPVRRGSRPKLGLLSRSNSRRSRLPWLPNSAATATSMYGLGSLTDALLAAARHRPVAFNCRGLAARDDPEAHLLVARCSLQPEVMALAEDHHLGEPEAVFATTAGRDPLLLLCHVASHSLRGREVSATCGDATGKLTNASDGITRHPDMPSE